MRTFKVDHSNKSQQGAVLVVVLVLMLVMSLLGAASMRGTLFQERMSASQLDRGLAFQAAEAALREGELLAASKPAVPAAGCDAGLCGEPDPRSAPVWEDADAWAAARTLETEFDNVTVEPQYLVELLADDVPAPNSCTTSGDISASDCGGTEHRYRVTARVQMPDRAAVVLQSIYAVP